MRLDIFVRRQLVENLKSLAHIGDNVQVLLAQIPQDVQTGLSIFSGHADDNVFGWGLAVQCSFQGLRYFFTGEDAAEEVDEKSLSGRIFK